MASPTPWWLEVAAYGSSLEQLLLDGIKDIAYAPALEVGNGFGKVVVGGVVPG